MTHAQAERETVRRLREQLWLRRQFLGGDLWDTSSDLIELPDGAVRILAVEDAEMEVACAA